MSSIPNVLFQRLQPKPDEARGNPCTRSSHGLSVLKDGKCLVLYGGEHTARTPLEDEQALWVAEQVDGDWQWRCMVPEVRPPARVAHAQASVSGAVYIFGGRAGITMQEQAMNDLWKLDTNTWTWSEVSCSGDVPAKRSFHRMLSVGDEYLYVFGGCGDSGRLADLYRLHLATYTWEALGASPLLRGRGGANLLLLDNDKLAVVAGFAGEETCDGHVFDTSMNTWHEELMSNLEGLRPRSVCVAASLSERYCLIFGGEVNPSERGHEGAGGFANDVVLLDKTTGQYLESVAPTSLEWPETRGWSDGASNGMNLFFYGGLAGDDVNPRRLDDLWMLSI